jgi:hypothetical protein
VVAKQRKRQRKRQAGDEQMERKQWNEKKVNGKK